MKKRVWCLGLALCMALTGCGARTAQETPAPLPSGTLETTAPTLEPTVSLEPTASPSPTETAEPTATPTPAPLEDSKGYILGCIDRVLEQEKMSLYFWQHPGSGPSVVELKTEEYREIVKAMFDKLDWDGARLLTEEECNAAYEAQNDIPGIYDVTLIDEGWGFVGCGLDRDVVRVNGRTDNLYFHVGGAEKLCEKLTDMVPSAYVNLGRVRVPPQKTKEATIKLYVETALKQMKKNGHITDYALRSYEVITSEEGETPAEEEEYPSFAYTATYAIKPAKPELAYWQGREFDDDGWVEESIQWELLAYDERDGCYGMY